MFVWRGRAALAQMRTHLPAHVDALARAVERDGTPTFDSALVDAFTALPRVSIDYGLMEKATDVACVAASFSWADVGSFASFRSRA